MSPANHLSQTQLFSGALREFPGIPAHWPAAKRLEAARMIDDLLAVFPDAQLTPADADPAADIEDFWEDAARISAAWRASGGQIEVVTGKTDWTQDELDRRLGPVSYIEAGGRHARDAELSDPLLATYGGRAMFTGSINGPAETDVAHWLAARHRDHGVARGIVKNVETKGGLWSLELDSDPAVVQNRLADAMGWAIVRLDEAPNSVVAQDLIDLQWEYRLFVVDGEVVSGAGCVEEFTPLDRTPGRPFDTLVRQYRGHHSPEGKSPAVSNQPWIVAELVSFGRTVAREHGGTVVIDVAIDAATGQPVVVELNTLPNSGLYASDPWAVARALVQAADRGYVLPVGDLSATSAVTPLHAAPTDSPAYSLNEILRAQLAGHEGA